MRKQERLHSANNLPDIRERIYRESLSDTALCFIYNQNNVITRLQEEIKMKIPKSPLFAGVETHDLDSMMSCLSAKERNYKKNEFIFHTGDKVTQIGMVLEGTVHMMKEDVWGNVMILGEAGPGDLFGEVYACAGVEHLEVSVVAKTDVKVLFFSIAARTLAMTRKVEHMSQRSLRDKVLSYLSSESVRAGSEEFTISFNRQQLAEYLSVDRSALSAELGKMRDEGMLEFRKNYFKLKL